MASYRVNGFLSPAVILHWLRYWVEIRVLAEVLGGSDRMLYQINWDTKIYDTQFRILKIKIVIKIGIILLFV